MNIYTLNVAQGQFVVIEGQKEVVIVDTYVPLNADQKTTFVKGALPKILKDKKLKGVIFTGFDDDHFCDVGVQMALNKYRPDWVMYPRYYKQTKTATECFKHIDGLEAAMKQQQLTLQRHSIDLADARQPRVLNSISSEFIFELFSPHKAGMNSSNNGSIVCKVTERATGATYLITGDTEVDRWADIVKEFKDKLKSQVMAAPHHGSKNGITAEVMKYVQPHTVIISAGIDSKYGHPHAEAIEIYKAGSQKFYRTNIAAGQSIRTAADGKAVNSYKYEG